MGLLMNRSVCAPIAAPLPITLLLLTPVIRSENPANEDQNAHQEENHAHRQHDDGDHHAKPEGGERKSNDDGGHPRKDATDDLGNLMGRTCNESHASFAEQRPCSLEPESN